MSLFSIQRGFENDLLETDSRDKNGQSQSIEYYCAIKGIIFRVKGSYQKGKKYSNDVGEVKQHLRAMANCIRPQDTITLVVQLESLLNSGTRYLAVVSIIGKQNTEMNALLGFDWNDNNDTATLGMVLPVYGDTSITFDGDGGFIVSSDNHQHTFKPVSVQSMWSAVQALHKTVKNAVDNNHFPRSPSHAWVRYFLERVNSPQEKVLEWNTVDIESKSKFDSSFQTETDQSQVIRNLIRNNLRVIFAQVDIEEVTCKQVRELLEERMKMDLQEYKEFIDECMIVILRQMDSSSEIFPYLFLGSEWNASNIEELKTNDIKYILNVTQEIDNFFPNKFEYKNIRVLDEVGADLITNWNETYKFIKTAKNRNCKVLVHCKMGVSRSASTVIAYAMKEYKWSLQTAMDHVKSCRSCVEPNAGFQLQLETYEGLLKAGRLRHSHLWRRRSYSDTSIKQLISFRRNRSRKKNQEASDKASMDKKEIYKEQKTNHTEELTSDHSCVSRLVNDYKSRIAEGTNKEILLNDKKQARSIFSSTMPREIRSYPNFVEMVCKFENSSDRLSQEQTPVSSTKASSICIKRLSSGARISKSRSDESLFLMNWDALENTSRKAGDTIRDDNVIRSKSFTEFLLTQDSSIPKVTRKGYSERSERTVNTVEVLDGTETSSKSTKKDGLKVFKNYLSKTWQASKVLLRQGNGKSQCNYDGQHNFDESNNTSFSMNNINLSVEKRQKGYDNYFDADTLNKLIASPDNEIHSDDAEPAISVKRLTLKLELREKKFDIRNSPSAPNDLRRSSTNNALNSLGDEEISSDVKKLLRRSTSNIKDLVDQFESNNCRAL